MRTPLDPQLADRMVMEWLVRQRAQRETTPPAPAPQLPLAPVITISRQLGSDAGEVTEALRAQLGESWQVWDSALLDEVARRADVRRQLLEEMDEREQSQIELTMRSLVGAPVVEEFTYRHQLAEVMLALARRGRAIIVGRGATFMLPDALKVRLRAAFSYRVQNMQRVSGWSREAAERQVRASDRERGEFVRTEFERDIDAADLYDLVISTDNLGVQPTAAAVAAACRARFLG